jgi:pimeloyl-ACP methyl ester carboxylesterase
MHSAQLTWTWQGKTVDLGFDVSGHGPTVLLLPALSSISTRREMWPLQQRLSLRYRTVSVDWPGFGDQARVANDWKPGAYAAFLEYILDAVAPSPHAVVARGTRRPLHSLTPALGPARSGGLFWWHRLGAAPCLQ